jgi:SAM-dependent methyltransferase
LISEQRQVQSSFRDPGGRVFQYQGRILRVIDQKGRDSLDLSRTSPALRPFIAAGNFIGSRELEGSEVAELLQISSVQDFALNATAPVFVEHDAIPFPSFPYEWPPEMLHAAGSLTLELCEALLDDGVGLKDATPYNVLYRGSQPVFVDVLSAERRRPNDPVWLAYAQFVRTFLLPLLASQRWRTPLSEVFLSHRDGLQTADVYRRCGVFERFRPGILGLVSVPTWLESRKSGDENSIYRPRSVSSEEQARFILRSTFRGLRKKLEALKPVALRSTWSEYAATNTYSNSEASRKQEFVISVMQKLRPRRVLDVGCNTGVFSLLAAKNGASVVALDFDEASVGALFRTAAQEKLSILPLVVDIARPTPGIGWNNAEHTSFLSRAAGHFDAVFMLALVHHLLVTERVPLPGILDLAATLTNDILVIEYVGRSDSMFKKIVRGREALHEDFTREVFEHECKRLFNIVESTQVQADRWLYLLRRLT